MSAKASVFIATSLDGFIARADGSIDWLDAANALVPSGEDCGYSAFMETVDVLVMGKNTFATVSSFSAWPYADKKVVVLSSKPLQLPLELSDKVSTSAESPAVLLERLSAAGAKRLYVDGGITIQRFLAAGLIDDITITLIPVLLGQGRPLFGPMKNDVPLVHVATRTFEFGFVQLQYRVARHT
ncbi:dihydrofolate reductase family protein [Dechloromonas denitrificans]|uniref:dihydrofolate reductase family protein n=1 Tax=Dechloromonas denitrificans TaxID=281362 RepID=UPI001CFA2A02|nr:dihydrofolate reductase family protein [Dechloromonas denitrificans]UCV09316.1 dihydrofolate reductase [Dechloromonas denitrificans]